MTNLGFSNQMGDSADAVCQLVLVQAPGWGINTPPLGIASLAAYLRGHEFNVMQLDINIDLYNMNSEKHREGWMVDVHGFWTNELSVNTLINENKEILDRHIASIISSGAKVVGFTIFVSSYLMSCYLARELKKRSQDITIIFGGPHASLFMLGNTIIEQHNEVDIVVLGEGEETLLDIMQKIRDAGNIAECAGILYRQDGKPVKSADRKSILKLDSLPFPDFSDFDFSLYNEPYKIPITSSRSCVNKCIYCNDRPYWGSYRFRSGKSMFEEVIYQMDRYPDCNYFEFYDCLVNGNVKELEVFCDLLITNNTVIRWSGQAIIRKEMQFDLLVKLKKSGCICLAYGLESTSPSVLKYIGKTCSDGVDIDKLTLDHQRSGLGYVFNFMFGLPGETDHDAEENIRFLEKNAEYIGGVNPAPGFCMFSPGTLAYDDPNRYGIDLSNGGYYWNSLDGSNTFLKRLERFEKFIATTHKLGINSVYTKSKLENRNGTIANYFFTIRDYKNAVPYYIKALQTEHKNQTNISRLKTSCEYLGESYEQLLDSHSITFNSDAEPDTNLNQDNITDKTSDSTFSLTNFSDENWLNGIARSWTTAFFVPNSAVSKHAFILGAEVLFGDGSIRKIIETKNNDSSIIIFLDGEPLDGAIVGYPNKIKILNNKCGRLE